MAEREMITGELDENTRCAHYHSPLDIIAIKFKCCNRYYSCYYCHQELADHAPERWRKEEFDELAIVCGVCKVEMSINAYKNCDYRCPACRSAFNPKCGNHDKLYFCE
jgi:uncharacterized CHY-type Zn-finger protein